MYDISVVLPIFNEEDCIDELFSRLTGVLSTLVSSFELIFVDDGSSDRSWEKIEHLLENKYVKAIKFSRNFGHHAAITAGLDHAEGDWVVVMDSDLQDLPEEIPRLYEKALAGNDLVYAKRKNKTFGFVKRSLSSLFYKALSRLSDINFEPEVGVFRLISKRAVTELVKLRETVRFFPGLVQWIGFNIDYVDVKHGERFAGETKYPLSKQLALALDATLAYTDKPLKVAIYLGGLFSVLGFSYGLVIIIKAIMGQIEVLGYASLMSAILFLGGVTVSTIGITGIYVGRIFREVKGRPIYVIEELKSYKGLKGTKHESTIL